MPEIYLTTAWQAGVYSFGWMINTPTDLLYYCITFLFNSGCPSKLVGRKYYFVGCFYLVLHLYILFILFWKYINRIVKTYLYLYIWVIKVYFYIHLPVNFIFHEKDITLQLFVVNISLVNMDAKRALSYSASWKVLYTQYY